MSARLFRVPTSAFRVTLSPHELRNSPLRGAGRNRVRDDQPPRQAERPERPGRRRARRRRGTGGERARHQGSDPHRRRPEVKLGIAPGYGGTQRLPRLVGKGNALQLILTGETIDAREAHRIGLVNKVVPAAELLTEAERMVRGVVGMGPLAVRLALEAVDRGLEMTLDEGLLLEANHFGLLATTRDMKEGLTAFLEKRAPKFEGR